VKTRLCRLRITPSILTQAVIAGNLSDPRKESKMAAYVKGIFHVYL